DHWPRHEFTARIVRLQVAVGIAAESNYRPCQQDTTQPSPKCNPRKVPLATPRPAERDVTKLFPEYGPP
ncbi:hypothetical protein, partial [Nocardia sp. NPDC057030]|uniref:hypothetical protein n=1 Tax=unclassified Nocardia TaxID=2637762 RepID=UPI003641CA0A